MVLGNGTLTNAVQVLRYVIDLGNTGERETGRVEFQSWRIIKPGIIRKLLIKSAHQHFLKQEHMEDVQKLRVGKEFNFSQWFPGLPIVDGEISPRPESDDRRKWLNNIWEGSGERGIVSIGSIENLFKVYLVICGFRMRDVSDLMR